MAELSEMNSEEFLRTFLEGTTVLTEQQRIVVAMGQLFMSEDEREKELAEGLKHQWRSAAKACTKNELVDFYANSMVQKHVLNAAVAGLHQNLRSTDQLLKESLQVNESLISKVEELKRRLELYE